MSTLNTTISPATTITTTFASTIESITNSSINSTATTSVWFNTTTIDPPGFGNTTYNDSISDNFTFPPWYFPTVPSPVMVPPIVISSSSNYFAASFYYYLILMILLILALLFTKLAIRRRQELAAAQQRARARRRGGPVSTISNGRTDEGGESGAGVPKDMDLPPAYDEVMQTYIDAKLRMQAAEEEGAVGGGLSSSISTNTIETNLEEGISSMDLTIIAEAAPSTATATATTTTTTVAQITTTTTSHPPSYESTLGTNANNNKNNNNDTRDSIV